MKRVLAMLFILLGLWSFAGAEEIDSGAEKAIRTAYPQWEIIAADSWGSAAAAALAMGDERLLCLAEEYNGAWQVVIANPTALLPGKTPQILMDTDVALYWTYQDDEVDWPVEYRFSSMKRDGMWDSVSCTMVEINGEGVIDETSFCWRDDGVMWRLFNRYDWNENQLSHKVSAYVPAGWMADCIALADYDVNRVPRPALFYSGSWLGEEYLALAAAELKPDYTFLGGSVNDAGLKLFMRRPDGARVLLGVTSRGITGDWNVQESSPLPEDAFFGYENFTDSLAVGEQLVSVRPFADGSWGVEYIWPLQLDDTTVFMGRRWLAKDNLSRMYMGEHPWSDITAIDWSSLPHSLEEALTQLNQSAWAVVNNPDPADRLHLRVRPDRGAESMGKYYNGTPVEVLEKDSTWTKVRVQGLEGWMMTKYLAFGGKSISVEPAWPDLYMKDDRADIRVYEGPGSASPNRPADDPALKVTGIVEGGWYHVWFFESDSSGYMKEADLWPGNG